MQEQKERVRLPLERTYLRIIEAMAEYNGEGERYEELIIEEPEFYDGASEILPAGELYELIGGEACDEAGDPNLKGTYWFLTPYWIEIAESQFWRVFVPVINLGPHNDYMPEAFGEFRPIVKGAKGVVDKLTIQSNIWSTLLRSRVNHIPYNPEQEEE